MALFKNKKTGDVITATGPNEKYYAAQKDWERHAVKPTKPADQNTTQQGA